MNDAIETEQRLADLGARTAESKLAVVEDANWPEGVVTVVYASGARQTIQWEGDAPWEGDTVRVTTASQKSTCKAVWPPAIGVVAAVVGSIATVTLDDGTSVDRPFIGVVPGVGDLVHVNHAGRVITGVYSTPPPGSDYQAPPRPPAGGSATVRFVPIGSGNYRSGSFDSQLLTISDSRSAYVFYGTQVRDTVPAGATNVRAELVLSENWDRVPGVPSKLGTHGWSGGVPGSPPGLNLSGAIDVSDGGSINVGSLIGQLIAGTAFGFGFPAAIGYREFAALPDLWVAFDY